MVDFIVEFLSSTGYIGVFLLMALENILPPIPSEMIMPFAGFVASKGELNVIGCQSASKTFPPFSVQYFPLLRAAERGLYAV